MRQPILELKNVSVHFGGIKAVCEFSFQLFENDIAAIIGPNGAGKTTAFNVVTGVYQPTLGDVIFRGRSVVGLKPHQITGLGIARTFQNIRLFKELSVKENILIAMDRTAPGSLLRAWFKTPKFWQVEVGKAERVAELLKIFSLDKITDDVAAKNLPYGYQRRLEMARAIATGAKVLLLDEPAAGMNGVETAQLMQTILQVKKQFNLSVLLIEHDMKLVMNLSERIAVLEYGKKIAEGTPKEIQADQNVIRAYLGTETAVGAP